MGRSKAVRVVRSASENLAERIRQLKNRLFRKRQKKQLTKNDILQVETEHLKTIETLQKDLEDAREQLGYQILKTAAIAEDRDIILRHQAVRFAAERSMYREVLADLGVKLSRTVFMERQILLLQKKVRELERVRRSLLKTIGALKTSEEEETASAKPEGDTKAAERTPWSYVTTAKVIKSGSLILQEARDKFSVSHGASHKTDVRKARSTPAAPGPALKGNTSQTVSDHEETS